MASGDEKLGRLKRQLREVLAARLGDVLAEGVANTIVARMVGEAGARLRTALASIEIDAEGIEIVAGGVERILAERFKPCGAPRRASTECLLDLHSSPRRSRRHGALNVAVESPPQAGALWLDNWVLDSRIADISSQQQYYPAKNLLRPHRSESWRSTAASNAQYVVFDFGSAVLPTCLAMTDVNFDAGTFIRLRGSTNSDQTLAPIYYDLPPYAQENSRVLRWYLGAPTFGTAAAREFWGVRILPAAFGSYGTTEDLFEIGSVFIGEYINIAPDQGVRISSRNPSDRQEGYGRAQWSDPLRSYHEIDLALPDLTFAEFHALKSKIVRQGARHALLDLHAYSTDSTVKGSGCFYGYFAGSPVNGSLDAPELNDLRV